MERAVVVAKLLDDSVPVSRRKKLEGSGSGSLAPTAWRFGAMQALSPSLLQAEIEYGRERDEHGGNLK